MTTRADVIINAAFFYVSWLIAVTGAAHGAWWAGPIAVGVFAAYELATRRDRRSDLVVIAAALLIGAIADTTLARTGMVRYASAQPHVDFAPIWILALWVNFALTLNHSLAFLKRNLWIAAGLGVIGAPLSYYFAARTWHAITLATPLPGTLLVIGAIWIVVTPLLAWLARRIDPMPKPTTRAMMTERAW